MYVNFDKFIDKEQIIDLNNYMINLNFKKLQNQTFGFTNNSGIKKNLGNGITLTEINENIVDKIMYDHGNRIERKTITGDGYCAPSRFNFIWEKTSHWHRLSKLRNFIKSLPFFEYTTRIVIIHTPPGTCGVEHLDHRYENRIDEFVWIRTNDNKKFYIRDINGKKKYIDCNIAWFDTRFKHNTSRVDKPSFSIRIDGKFTPKFRKYIFKNGTFRYKTFKNQLKYQSTM